MESIFEENELYNPVKGGTWKSGHQDSQEFFTLLNAPTLLEEPKNEGEIFLSNEKGNLLKYYGIVYNELFYVVKSESDQTSVLYWINLKFRRIQKVYHKKKPGFKIIGNQQFVEEFCIQLNLEQLYIKEKQVGKGTYSTVYLGKEVETNEVIAIKSASKQAIRESQRGVDSIIQEIETMRGLNDNNLMGLFGVFEDEENVHMIVELSAGGDLFKRIVKRKKFSEYNAARFAQGFLSSLVYLHEKANVCHRDIRPENILIKFDPENPNLNLKCGTPGYIAPEIFKEQVYGPKVDVFSLGIIVYIILVGRQPFLGKNPQEILEQNRDCKINFQAKHWHEISQEAMHFVINLTDPDPATRPTAREALEHSWFQNVCPDTYEQLPANLLQTPIVSRIQLLSPGITPESRLISRDKIAKNMERKGENDIFRWNEITYSPVVSPQQRIIRQMDPSKTEKLQGRDLNKENIGTQSQKVAIPQRNPAIGKKITGHLLQNEKQQLESKQENQKNNFQAVKQEQLFRFSSPKLENQRKLEENKTVDSFPITLEKRENEAI